MGIPLSNDQRKHMLAYLELLQKWGKTYNLSAIRELPPMVPHHILDSLSAAPFCRGPRMLDIGSGAGLPGLPLAIAQPELSVTLIESRQKRIQFLIHVASSLRLANVEIVHLRVERYQPSAKFDTLITRAFSTIAEFVDKAAHLCAKDGRIIALKGQHPGGELDTVISKGFTVHAVRPVNIPGLGAQRHIAVLSPSGT